MTEDETLGPFERAANDINENSWDRERQTPEFQQIQSDLEALRKKIFERKPMFGQSKEGPLPDMTYDAASELLGATRDLFQNPVDIADTTKDAVGYFNQSRNAFLVNLAEMMDALHIKPEDLAASLAKKHEIDDSEK